MEVIGSSIVIIGLIFGSAALMIIGAALIGYGFIKSIV